MGMPATGASRTAKYDAFTTGGALAAPGLCAVHADNVCPMRKE